MEQRANPRRPVDVVAHAALAPGHNFTAACTIDASAESLLLSFDELVGVSIGDRLIVSLEFPDGRFHVMGTVRRLSRGEDFRSYVALTLHDLSDEDHARYIAQLDLIEIAARGS